MGKVEYPIANCKLPCQLSFNSSCNHYMSVCLSDRCLVSHRMNSFSTYQIRHSQSSLMCKVQDKQYIFKRSNTTTVPNYAPSPPVKLQWWQNFIVKEMDSSEWLTAAQVQLRDLCITYRVKIHNGKIIVRHAHWPNLTCKIVLRSLIWS